MRGVKPSVPPQYDEILEPYTAGSAAIPGTIDEIGQVERIRIGTGYHRDSELFITIFHEEMHIRVKSRALQDQDFYLNIATLKDDFEEVYVEEVAKRYLRLYEYVFGPFDH